MASEDLRPRAPEYDEYNRQRIESAQKGVLGFFVRRHRFTVILAVLIAIWGGFSLLGLPREANPEVKVPFAIVTTFFPGASPADVEELVTDKIEEKVESLEHIKELNSSSSFSVSTVAVEFEAEADLDKSIQDLKDAVDQVIDLPTDAETPVVTEVNFNDVSVVTVSLLGNLSDLEFKDLGKQL